MDNKIKTKEEIEKIVKELKQKGKKIVTCNGCFDILHAGHIKFLKEAKQQGDVLIVGLNSDSSVKLNKGPKRPINNEKDRAAILATLKMVDYITIFNEKTPIPLLEIIKPDIHCNGEEYGENCIEKPVVKKYGGKIHIIKLKQGFSTTDIIKRIKKTKYYSISKNFSIFTIIGVIYALLQIFLLWLLIDTLRYNTLLTTAIVASTIYITKFYTYVGIGLMHNKFMKYNVTNLLLLFLSILAIWVLVDFLGFYASISSAITALIFFVLRFAALHKAELIKKRKF